MPLGRAVSGIGELISNAQESPAGKVDIGVSGDGPIGAGDYWNNRRKNGGAED